MILSAFVHFCGYFVTTPAAQAQSRRRVVIVRPYYRIYRDGKQIGDLHDAGPFASAALTDGTYQFTVLAVDTAGNESAPSAPASVTVDRAARSSTALMWRL